MEELAAGVGVGEGEGVERGAFFWPERPTETGRITGLLNRNTGVAGVGILSPANAVARARADSASARRISMRGGAEGLGEADQWAAESFECTSKG